MTNFELIIIVLVSFVGVMEFFQVVLKQTIVKFLKEIREHVNKDNF